MTIGEVEYRRAGWERLHEAGLLFRDESFAGGVYLAGRGVESMLRAVIWKADTGIRSGRRSLDTGHNLRELLVHASNLGVFAGAHQRDKLLADVEYVSRLWFNNMRFFSTQMLQSHWWQLGETGKKRTLKQAAWDYYNSCISVAKRSEALCKR